ncbi:MAG TPA: hypothetical protein PKY59_01350 [Pyrinomonadaceae bacterium]|nr:hypothetical protein [Pyrinomonadaceae bacterium]
MKVKYLQLIFLSFVILFVFQNVSAQSKQPKNVREYFMLLPQTYFAIESCNTDIVKDCRPYKVEYLKSNLRIEDTKNGYLEGDGDGSQEHFKMALFKRPNGSHIIGLYVFGEWGEKYYFLEYKNRRWINVSKSVVPNYRRSNIYEMPRYGTTVEVYERKNFDPEYDFGEQGRKLYSLVWKNGKFSVKK